MDRPRGADPSLDHPGPCQALVRFLAYHRIKPHAPPLVRVPVNSFEFHPSPTFPRTPGVHRLLCGLPGYLNLFAPRTFVPQRQYMASRPPSPPVFFQISTDFTPTPGIPTTPPVLQHGSSKRITGLGPELSHLACRAACAPFTPNDSEQRSPPTYYRGCWHVVSRGLFRDRGAIPCLAHSPSRKGLYNLTAFIVHAASLRQTFVHCGRSLAAASRRSLGRSQSQCGRPPSQAGYPSSPWWALTPPTS